MKLSLRLPAGALKAREGYSLMEILITLAIIGLLVGLVGPQLLNRLDQSRVTTAETQVRMLRSALDTYRLDVGRYPTEQQGLDALVSQPSDLDDPTMWRGPYLDSGEVPLDPWGAPYVYSPDGRATGPVLYAYGADGRPGGSGDNADVGLLPDSGVEQPSG